MDELKIRQISMPITTGALPSSQKIPQEHNGSDFGEMLQKQMELCGGPSFSKHAANRVLERNIDVSANNLEKLNEGMKLAEQKGLREPLILVDGTAFIVSVANKTVITTVHGNELKGNVFTNIDGTVII